MVLWKKLLEKRKRKVVYFESGGVFCMYMMLPKLRNFFVFNWAQNTESSLIACCCWGAILFRFCLQQVTKYHDLHRKRLWMPHQQDSKGSYHRTGVRVHKYLPRTSGIWLGTFNSERVAAKAYDSAAIKIRSGDSRRNFPGTNISIQDIHFQNPFSKVEIVKMIKDGSYPFKFRDFLKRRFPRSGKTVVAGLNV